MKPKLSTGGKESSVGITESSLASRPTTHEFYSGISHALPAIQRLREVAGNRSLGRWIQTKLKLGSRDSPAELEADRVAEQVTIADGAPSTRATSLASRPLVQRKCNECEEDDKRHVRTKLIPGLTSASRLSADSRIDGMRGSGEPLEPALLSYFEPRMGADFGGVRIHRDAHAAETAQTLNALAFTAGRDIAFGPGQYAPETLAGKKLIAHELTHVVQQSQPGADPPHTIRRQPKPDQDPPFTSKGDAQRTSPPGGVPLANGALTWNERFVGVSGSFTVGPAGIQISQATDVQMDVEFMPSATAAAKCPTITFLQTVKPTVGGIPDTPRLLFTRDSTSGASADVLQGEAEPFYGIGQDPAGPGLKPDMGSSTVAGSAAGRSAKASFGDTPIVGLPFIPPGQRAVREFEVAPICAESGQTFGSIKWGYTKTHGGEIELTGGQAADVKTGSATPQLENVRRAFYSGFFQFSVPDFSRGSAALTSAHKKTLKQVVASGAARKFVLVGSNDFSGGPENNASLSLQRAEAVQKFLIQEGIPADRIEVRGHGVEARVPNAPGHQEPQNRRVDIHIERGFSRMGPGGEFHNPLGGARENLRFRRQDPRETFEELIALLTELQSMAKIPTALCNQLTHMTDGLRRARSLDRSVPDVDVDYGATIANVRRRCVPLIDRPPIDLGPTPLEPPNFIHKIEESVDEAGI